MSKLVPAAIAALFILVLFQAGCSENPASPDAAADGAFVSDGPDDADAVAPPNDAAATEPEAGPPAPAPAPVRFAFKAGLDREEQIWLWLEDERPFHLSTWAATDPETGIARSTTGYREGSGRFGPMSFDSTRRFLLTSERIADPSRTPQPISWRFSAVELASGKLTTDLLMAAPAQIAVTASATFVVATPGEGAMPGPWLYEFVAGRLQVAAGAEAIPFDRGGQPSAVEVGSESIFSMGTHLLHRTQGRWTVFPGFDTNYAWSFLAGARAGDAACIMGFDNSRPGERVALLLTAGAEPRKLPCEGTPTECAISPDGGRVYLTGCREPVISYDGKPQAAPSLTVFPGADVRLGDGWRTIATLGPGPSPGPQTVAPVMALFDWSTSLAATFPPPSKELLPDHCAIIDVAAPADGKGLAVVWTHCGCIDCYDGSRFAIDLGAVDAPENLAATTFHLIHPTGESLFSSSLLFGARVVTAVHPNDLSLTGADGSPTFIMTESAGSRSTDPLPGVRGLLHHPVR